MSESVRDLDTSRPGQIATGVGGLAVSGALAYYLGADTNYFSNPANASEVPLYVAFTAMSLLAVRDLVNICGRKSTKTMLAGLLNGGTVGLGTGLGVAGIALGALGDLLLCGGLTTLGLLVGFLITRRGKKKHSCHEKLPCDTWICPKCKRIICPSQRWSVKDRWNILDVCDYLDTGGHEMDSIQALAFLDYSGLIDKAKQYAKSPALWNPNDIKAVVSDDGLRNQFSIKWDAFQRKENVYTKFSEDSLQSLFDKWRDFSVSEK